MAQNVQHYSDSQLLKHKAWLCMLCIFALSEDSENFLISMLEQHCPKCLVLCADVAITEA